MRILIALVALVALFVIVGLLARKARRSAPSLLAFQAFEQGYNTAGDVVTQTADGRPLQDLWDEFQATVALINEKRQRIIDFLTYPVTNVIEDVPTISSGGFELASEFGVPVSERARLTSQAMSFDFDWYDRRVGYTWQFFLEASANQVEAIHQSVLEADNRNIFTKIMRTVFNPSNLQTDIKGNPIAQTVYKFWNGDGIMTPPPYGANVFDSTHSHYLVSGAATIDSGDLEQMIEHLRHHGYSATNGNTIVIMANPQEAEAIRRFRANTVNSNGANALYDFIPSTTQPALIVPSTAGLIGTQPAGQIAGLTVIGSYGPALIVSEDYIPAGYVFGFATGGEANLNNPIGLREHAQPSARGLRLIPGNNAAYPLIDSYYSRGFGTGVRQRGAGVVMQVKTTGSYAAPAIYV